MRIIDAVLSVVATVLAGLVLFGAIDPPDLKTTAVFALLGCGVAYGTRAKVGT